MSPVVFLSGHAKAIPLLLLVFICVAVISNVAFVSSLVVPRFSFFLYLGKVVHRDCGISCVSCLIFLLYLHFGTNF